MKKLILIVCFILCGFLASCSLFGGQEESAPEQFLELADYNVYAPAEDAAAEEEADALTVTRPGGDDDAEPEETETEGTIETGDILLDVGDVNDYIFFSLDFDESTPLTARGVTIGSAALDVAEAYGSIVPALITASNTDNITYAEFLDGFNGYDNGLRAALYDYTVAYNAVSLDGELISIPLLLNYLDETGRTLESYESPIPTYSLYFYITEDAVTDVCIEARGLSWQVVLENTAESAPPEAEEGEPAATEESAA